MNIKFQDGCSYNFDRGSVEFFVTVEGKTVQCFVSEEVLEDHFHSATSTKALLETFEQNRSSIEAEAVRLLEWDLPSPIVLTTAHF